MRRHVAHLFMERLYHRWEGKGNGSGAGIERHLDLRPTAYERNRSLSPHRKLVAVEGIEPSTSRLFETCALSQLSYAAKLGCGGGESNAHTTLYGQEVYEAS